ncbi:hypothetical protein VPH35_104500 [Triticum aestivum]
MRIYFRYLSEGQAMRYLRLGGADLAVAVQLGENQQFGPEDRHTTGAPDLRCGRTQFALKKGRPLSVGDVDGILSFLRLQHHAASPAVKVAFRRSPHPADMEIGRSLFGLEAAGGQALEAGERPARFFCPVGENHVAEVVVSRRRDGHVSSICDLRTPDEMKQMLLDSHTRYLKVCLADTIHALYIRAVSLLPQDALHRHLRGILVAGLACPLLEIDAVAEPDILDTRSMLHMVVRSLDSLVAMVCTATGFSDHMAVEYLCHKQCDLSKVLQTATKEVCYNAYVSAGQAGRHPKHLELATFLMSMADNVPKDSLLTHEAMGKGHVISDAALEQVYKIMEDQSSSTAPSDDHPRLCPSAWMTLASRKGEYVQKQNFLGQALEQLLLDYSNQHPWEPVPRLDVICGVKKQDRGHPKFYHANFLVHYDDVSSARVLFFAEVWQSSFRAKQIRSKPNTSVNLVTRPCTRYSRRVESSAQFIKVYSKSSRKEAKTSFCCPLPYYSPDDPYLDSSQLGELLEYLNIRDYNPSAADSITESDFVYFDCHRDAKFAEVLNERRSSEEKNPIIRWS